jgi:hypothetical protein
MFSKLLEIIRVHILKFLALPTLLGMLSFFGNLAVALSDGKLDGMEFHQLFSSANGIETFILMIIMVVLKNNNIK